MGKHKKEKRHKKHKKYKTKKNSSSSEEERHSSKKYDSSSEEEKICRKKKSQKYDSSSEEEKISRRKKSRKCDSLSEEKKIIRKKERRHASSESDSSMDSKRESSTTRSKDNRSDDPDDDASCSNKMKVTRDEWMNLSSAFRTTSNIDRKQERDQKKKLEREKEEYDPRTCDRELNPYWKSGGEGLPSFRKPVDSDEEDVQRKKDYKGRNSYKRESKWKKSRDIEASTSAKSAGLQNQEQSVLKGTPDRNIRSETVQEQVYTEKDLNILASKLVKAEIMGDTELVNELKEKLEKARESLKSKSNVEDVVLTRTDSQGRTQPLKLQSEYGEASVHKKKKTIETHKDGQRVRYFADDDKYSLKQMFENEKYNTVQDSNKEFSDMVGKIRKNDDMDDIFADNIRKKESDIKMDVRNRDRAIQDHKRVSKSLESCNKCIQSESMKKHLMISMGETAYLALPAFEPLTEGHCLIIPIRHVPCTTQLDENEWSEILNIKKSLIKLFKSKKEDVIFFESAKCLYHFPHMTIECIPLPKEEGDMAPIYFKKAIDESETEWAQNKKLVSLRGRDVRRAIPKGLPYFFVTFGISEGYAHVIEDEQLFPSNFAQEIIGGMLDLHHSKWKRPKSLSFDEQSKRVLKFSNEWKEYDCTSKVCE